MQIPSVANLAIHSVFRVNRQTATHAEAGIWITQFLSAICLVIHSLTESAVITVRRQRSLKQNYGKNANHIGAITYLAIYSLFQGNGHYCQIATYAELGIRRKTIHIGCLPIAIHSLFRVNGHYCQTATHADAGICRKQFLSIAYLVIHSLFGVYGHCC